MNDKKYSYIDLFAGAGGLSEGFIMQGDFIPVAHVEMNASACDTLRTRLVYHYLKSKNMMESYNKYLKNEMSQEDLYKLVPEELLKSVIHSEISEKSIKGIFKEIDKMKSDTDISDIDLIVGGPPCQAYSLMGRSVSKTNMRDDPRNYLYLQYVEFLKKYKPKMFVFENVPGLLTANGGQILENILKSFRDAGYVAEQRIQNAYDFGVLQNRRRVIIVGWRAEYSMTYPKFTKHSNPEYKVSCILNDLAFLDNGGTSNSYVSAPNQYLIESGIRNGDDLLTWHTTRKINKNDSKIYRTVIDVWNNESRRLKYDELPKELITHRNSKSFLDRFKVLASNVAFSHTMIAHIAKDGHYFIHPDIKQCRSISVREAARIQGFPDNYFFEGSRTAVFTQIGNAVPPLMAKNIACEMYSAIHNIHNKREDELK